MSGSRAGMRAMPYQLRLLGGPAIETEEGASPGLAAHRHPIALAAILAVEAGRIVTRDRLMALLWPDSDTGSARNRLRVTLHTLRSVFGQGAFVSVADGLRMDVRQIACDLLEFVSALEAGRPEQAVQAYGGPFLHGFHLADCLEFDEWAEGQRDLLARRHREALERLAERSAAAGDPSAAAEWWRRRAAEEPASGRVVVRLMHALERAGDAAAALAAAERYARLLRDEFDTEPSPEVQALAERIRTAPRAGDPPRSRAESAEAAAVVPPATPASVDALPVHLVAQEGRLRRRRRLKHIRNVLLLAGVASLGVLWLHASDGPETRVDADAIAVMPFRVTAADSSRYGYLREAAVDLLAARLTGEGVPRAVDSWTTLSAWRQALKREGGELTTRNAIDVAARLGAGQVLLGEIVVHGTVASVSARLLRVPDGAILAEDTRSGSSDEPALLNRVVATLLALTVGEARARLTGLSDSFPAARAYLAGIRSHRSGQYADAFQHFSRALEIDPMFAAAALWRTFAAGLTPCGACIAEADSAAWALRDRLSARDRLMVAGRWAIGPNYPATSSTAELLATHERAVAANGDRPEAWYRLGAQMYIYGAYAGVDQSIRKAGEALDSAIALDSTFAPAVQFRINVALEQRDSAAIRKYGNLYLSSLRDAEQADVYRWLVARALDDSTMLAEVRTRIHALTPLNVFRLVFRSALEGSPLADAESIAAHRLTTATASEWYIVQQSYAASAMIRGRVHHAIALTDSLVAFSRAASGAPYIFPEYGLTYLVLLAHADPGYERAALSAARELDAVLDRGDASAVARAMALCHAELARVLHGDTTGTRRTIQRIRMEVSDFGPAPFPYVGRMDVCPRLLEAGIEWSGPQPSTTPALDRLEALMRRGTGLELPGALANLMIARWRERQGDHRSALAAVRRRSRTGNADFIILIPAHLREEGRLAALTGDTAGAIDAYTYYLTLRDQPDPGPMEEEVRRVREHLATLTGTALRRDHAGN